jgi:hypothetical protein
MTGEAFRPGAPAREEIAPMASDPAADELRRRAASLRMMAGRLEATPLLTLHRWAGPETWTSPRADELRAQLAGDRARLYAAADELRDQARWLERRADALDVAMPGQVL